MSSDEESELFEGELRYTEEEETLWNMRECLEDHLGPNFKIVFQKSGEAHYTHDKIKNVISILKAVPINKEQWCQLGNESIGFVFGDHTFITKSYIKICFDEQLLKELLPLLAQKSIAQKKMHILLRNYRRSAKATRKVLRNQKLSGRTPKWHDIVKKCQKLDDDRLAMLVEKKVPSTIAKEFLKAKKNVDKKDLSEFISNLNRKPRSDISRAKLLKQWAKFEKKLKIARQQPRIPHQTQQTTRKRTRGRN